MWPLGKGYPERRPEEVDAQEYDYIIVGGGTAGCVLAARLSEDPNVSVLVLEQGAANDTFIAKIPLASSNILDASTGAVSWNCEPMKYCDNRQSLVFRGEVLGGTSRINGMVYTRGTAADYDAWADMGHPEWSFEKVLPYFLKSENTLNQPKSEYRGNSGPWQNQSILYDKWGFNAYRVVSQCSEAMGFKSITDANSPYAFSDGLATLDQSINRNRERSSTFSAFVPKEIALKRKNLTICTRVAVSRLIFSEGLLVFSGGSQPRAEGVRFQSVTKSDKAFSAKARKEVIVCSGALGSPQVLMLSGIGPREHLEEHGIKVVHDLPGVGSELTDHMSIPIAWEVPVTESLTYLATSPMKGALEFFKYLFLRLGLLSMACQALSLFVRSSSLTDSSLDLKPGISPSYSKKEALANSIPPKDYIPDIEIMPLATSAMDDLEEHKRLFSKIGVFSFLTTLVQPKSRGTVRLASSNPLDKPKVDFGFLSNPDDFTTARKAIRLALKLGDAMKSKRFPLIRPIVVPEVEKGDEAIDSFIRRRARTAYHYACTCRMAPENDAAPGVVDDELRVHGVQGLRVCDASVFPRIISSHLQAPVAMMAERLADMIKKS